MTSHLYDRRSPLRRAGSAYRCSPFRSTLTTRDITFRHVCSVYKCSPLHYSTLNTNYIRRLDMCAMCAVTGHVRTCAKYVRKQARTCPHSWLLGFARGIRLLGFSASRLLGFARGIRLLGFSASRLRSGNSASRLLGFSASLGEFGFSASRLLGFSASLGEFGFSASRLLGSPPPSAGPLYRRYDIYLLLVFNNL